MKKTVSLVLIVLLEIYVGLCGFLYLRQNALLYQPQERSNVAEQPSILLPVSDTRLLVTLKAHDGPDAILYFGGTGEDAARTLPAFTRQFPDHAIYMLNYRGYAGNPGEPSEKDNYNDAVALFNEVKQKHTHLTVIGRSLGTGIAVHLASEYPVSGLALITPYNSMVEIAASRYPLVPVNFLLHERYDSFLYAPKITVPTILLMAENDEIIPRASTESLFANFRNGVARLVTIKNADHNSISDSEDYYPLLKSIL